MSEHSTIAPTSRAKLLRHISTALDLVSCGPTERFAIVEAPLAGTYIQFYAPDPHTVVGEAVGIANMKKLSGFHMRTVLEAKMPALGWIPPTTEDGHGNWTRSWQVPGLNPHDVARLALKTLETAYGLHHRALAVTVSPPGQITT